jgi:curli biogenesis system outer membrane secretion channel CsgG/uncharacterized protein YgiM (DUF1202 family)
VNQEEDFQGNNKTKITTQNDQSRKERAMKCMRSVFLMAFLCTLLINCAPQIRTMVLKPAEIDLHGYTRVAVLKFEGQGGREIRDWVESSLINARVEQKPYFNVVNRSQMQQILGEQAFAATGAIDEATAAKMGKLLGVEAVIIGGVNGYETSEESHTEARQQPIFGTKPLQYKTVYVNVASRKAYVSFTANFIDVNTGEMMASDTFDGEKSANAEGGGAITQLPPRAKMLQEAANIPIGKFVKKIVPHYVPQSVQLRDKSDESSMLSFRESPEDKALNECIKRSNEFAKASQWDKSIEEFQKCLKIKGDSAAVYYNIGVAYESKGDLVRAKENYQKAQDLKPDEFYIKANSRIDQRLEEHKKLQVQLRKPVKPAEGPRAVAAVPTPPAPPAPVAPPPKPEAASSATSILGPKEAQAAVAPAPPVEGKPVVTAKPPVTYLVTIRAANIRTEANAQSKIIIQLKKGEKVEKLDKTGNWFKIKLGSGDTGWVFKDLVKESE